MQLNIRYIFGVRLSYNVVNVSDGTGDQEPTLDKR